MQDYNDIAQKNGVTLMGEGACQFCGATTERGVHECVEIFNLGFQWFDYSKEENHYYRFISVDAHTLQHPEIHGRWNNHFHLTRQRLMFHYNIRWKYQFSPKLSDHLNAYKKNKTDEFLAPPKVLQRGNITTTEVIKKSSPEPDRKEMILNWGMAVYDAWSMHHELVDRIAQGFLQENKRIQPL